MSDRFTVADFEPGPDAFDGLPRHMVEGLPIMVTVYVTQRGQTTSHDTQLERDGKPLTLGDRAPRFVPGSRDGWKAGR